MNAFRARLAISVLVLLATGWPGALGAERKTLDLTLDQAVQIALRQNPEILKAIEEIRRIRGLVVEVRAMALPNVGLSSRYNQTDPNLIDSPTGDVGSTTFSTVDAAGNPVAVEQNVGGFGAFTTQDKSWQISIEAKQVIYSGGQVKAALKIARFQQDSGYYSLRDTIERVVSEVRIQFYDVLVNRSLIAVQEESIELLEQELTDQQERFAAGTVPRFNVLRAEVELANAKPLLIRATNNTKIANLRLARTLGIEYKRTPAGVPPVNAVGELMVVPRDIDLAEAIYTAKERRAFLKVQRQQILIEVEQIKLEMAGYKPRLDFSGGYQVQNSQFSDDIGETVNGWFFGVTGSWDIFDGLETAGKVDQARARLKTAKITYEDSVLQVEFEVQEAYARLEEAIELLKGRKKNIDQALESVRLARERFQAGAGTQLDLLDARVALTRARVTELEARFDYNVALAKFDRVTGMDTKFSEEFEDPLSKRGERIKWQKFGKGKLPRDMEEAAAASE